MKAALLTGWGINAEAELAHAFERAGAACVFVHVNDAMERPGIMAGFQVIAFPGGFSFGDHLGSGQVLAGMFRRRLSEQLLEHIARGGLVLGICNGFQTLVRMGMLPSGLNATAPAAALVHNSSGVFQDSWVELAANPSNSSPWLNGINTVHCPIRHGEGRFVWANRATQDHCIGRNQIAFSYCGPNPNGSDDAIAGITDETGQVLGMMPHPEAFLVPEQAPNRQWRPEGLKLFQNAVNTFV